MSNTRKDLKELMDVLKDEFKLFTVNLDDRDIKVIVAKILYAKVRYMHESGYGGSLLESIEWFIRDTYSAGSVRGKYSDLIRSNSILKSVFNDMLELVEEVIEDEVEFANEEMGHSRKTRGLMTRG